MCCWFSASAVAGEQRVRWQLDSGGASLLTISVQLGFVAGALVSALLALPDRAPPRRLMCLGAVTAAAANLSLLACGTAAPGLAARFVTGAALALVYPPSLKAVSTWFRRGRGEAMGVMVGALTLGSALPHLLKAFGGARLEGVIAATSVASLIGGLLAEFVARDGPFPFPRPPFDLRLAGTVLRSRGVRLAYAGYFGHMWELYAMWTWFGVFITDRLRASTVAPEAFWSGILTFAVIGIGAPGCWLAGLAADRLGRTRVTAAAMLVSGLCALLIGIPTLPLPGVVILGLVWGFAVIADSAQFSAMVTELAEPAAVGTAVTLQLSLGFVLTVGTIWLVPLVRDGLGWQVAFSLLAIGPALGAASMLRLRAAPEAARVAGGLR